MGKNSLKKVLLRKIPVQLATEATISQARRHEKASYYIKAAVRMINHKRILVLQLYSRKDLVLGIKEPRKSCCKGWREGSSAEAVIPPIFCAGLSRIATNG